MIHSNARMSCLLLLFSCWLLLAPLLVCSFQHATTKTNPSHFTSTYKVPSCKRRATIRILGAMDAIEAQEQSAQSQPRRKRHDNGEEPTQSKTLLPPRPILIHWKGEKDPGYSNTFRHVEFQSALEAELQAGGLSDDITQSSMAPSVKVKFDNALEYHGETTITMNEAQIKLYNEAMQYISFVSSDNSVISGISREVILRTVERCSLIHAAYEVAAASDEWDELTQMAIADGAFEEMYKGGNDQSKTWSVRARSYGDNDRNDKKSSATSTDTGQTIGHRYSFKSRSTDLETEGVNALKDLLIQFHGKVDLDNPECKLEIFGGLTTKQYVLTREVAVGHSIFSIAPNTRKCITSTPLEPIAAFSLCNVAQIGPTSRILDPYAGSCTVLLAAAMLSPTAKKVGIEIAHNGIVNRDHVFEDFACRSLTPPLALIKGDSTDRAIRIRAKEAIGNQPFDTIIADPPYGIRESAFYNEKSPLEEMFSSIIRDREEGNRLLQVKGRLVAFVPVTEEETLEELLPPRELTEEAGLRFEVSREQVLNDSLSRWLVSYICYR